MDLIINNRKINADIPEVLHKLNIESRGKYMSRYKVSTNCILCNCPFHKDGHEMHPSCSINTSITNDYEYGSYKCWTCGEKGHLYDLISYCLNKDTEYGKSWLINNYGDSYIEDLPYINFNIDECKNKNQWEIIPEEILDTFEYDNPIAIKYLIGERKLNKNVIDYFKIGYDRYNNCITFPCRDYNGNLIAIFKRNVFVKKFIIADIRPKPIYLLDEAIKQNYNSIYVCESQINALTLYGWGYPSIALFGTGSKYQYNMLKHFKELILCFDGDDAGRKGIDKFISNISDVIRIKYIIPPEGKDINDLTKSEFENLPLYCR